MAEVFDASQCTFGLTMTNWGAPRLATGTVTQSSSTSFTVKGADGLIEIYTGTGFSNFNSAGVPTSGTVTGYAMQTAGGTPLITVTGASESAVFLTSGDGSTFNFGFMQDVTNGITFIGSSHGDTIPFQEFDTIHGGGGNDVFQFGFGPSNPGGTLDGGGGFNTIQVGINDGNSHITNLLGMHFTSIQALQFNDTGSQENDVSLDAAAIGAGLPANLTIIASPNSPDFVTFLTSTPGTYDLSHLTFDNWTNANDGLQLEGNGAGPFHLIGAADVSTAFTGSSGNDTFTGGSAYNLVVYFNLTPSQATFAHNADGSWTVSGPGIGSDTLQHIEAINFISNDVNNTIYHVVLQAEWMDRTDFAARGESDILFGQSNGALAIWEMNGTAIVGGGSIGAPGGTWAEKGVGDFTGNGHSGVLFQDATGDLAIWEMNGTAIVGGGNIGNPGGTWAEKAIGNFGTGTSDLLFQDASGNLAIWEMNGTSITGGGDIGNPGGTWAFKGIGDFNGDGPSDILFQDASGNLAIWEMRGTSIIGGGDIGNPGGTWQVKGVGDFNGDGKSDILFEDAAGNYAIWDMNGTQIIGGGAIGNPGGTWQFAGVGDYNGDGFSDILFKDASGALAIWEMHDTAIVGGGAIGNPGAAWHILN